jgi:N-formylmaleamate deformylase
MAPRNATDRPSKDEEIMADWTSGFVTANGIRTHYTRTGGDKPPLVMAHGVTDDGLCWSPIATALEADYDVIMVDARGHGKSDAPDSGYEPGTLGADLAGVIRGLGLNRPIVLGHSMGAGSTLALASANPDLPGAILLEDPPPWWMGRPATPDPRMQDLTANMRAWIVGLKEQTREQMIADQHAATPEWSDAELQPWADAKVAFDLKALALFSSAVLTSVDWSNDLPKITCPTLLITADPDRGAIVTEAAAARLQELIPQAAVVHIGGAGHNIRREQPAKYLETVRTFLAGL